MESAKGFIDENDHVSGSLQYLIRDNQRSGIHESGLGSIIRLENRNLNFSKIQILDYISGNADRYNGKNYLVLNESKVLGIDFGLAFGMNHGGWINNTDQLFIDADLVEHNGHPIVRPGSQKTTPEGFAYNFNQLNRRDKDKILNTTVGQIIINLANLLNAESLNRLVNRFNEVQRLVRLHYND